MQEIREKWLRRNIVYVVIFGVGIILLCNTNNNPTKLIERIMPPVKIKSEGWINLSSIIVLILVYISAVKLLDSLQWNVLRKIDKFLHPFIKQIFIFGLVGIFGQSINEVGIQVYKSFQNDLSAIYFNREDSNLKFEWTMYNYNENEEPKDLLKSRHDIIETYKDDSQQVIVQAQPGGYIELKNCSNHPIGPFKMRLIIKENFEDHLAEEEQQKEYVYDLKDEYIISPKQTERISFTNKKSDEISLQCRGNGYTSSVKLVLIGDGEECVFENEFY